MGSHLFTENFEIETTFFSYPARFVAPFWGNGFECQAGSCGFCCLTELPDEVPKVHNVSFDKAICGFFDKTRKKCKTYETRPIGCRSYPFFFGVEEGQIIVSTTLECPGTNSGKKIEKKVIQDLFKEPYIKKRVTLINDYYEKAILLPHVWSNSNSVWGAIKNSVENYFSKDFSFPFLQDVTQQIYDAMSEVLGRDSPKIKPFPASTLIKNSLGLYIATRFESIELGLTSIKGSKIIIALFDNELREIRRKKFKIPLEFRALEIDKRAKNLFRDYVSLLLNRPFISLAVMTAPLDQMPMSLILAQALSGSFVAVEAGATLFAFRDKLKQIDREGMRELISFSEGTNYSAFKRPDKGYRF